MARTQPRIILSPSRDIPLDRLRLYCNIANAPGDDAAKKVLIWNPPS